ncbi:hypothetical protein KEJ21_00945, partial [Candidatus Bathyarchaeota archaeon]|nr:hypothetical protein [Candidatus Bathyarchaeota archaeon]
EITCPKCGSKELGVFDRTVEEVRSALLQYRRVIPKEASRWWNRGRDWAKIVSLYGRRGIIIASARRVNLEEAWEILGTAIEESDDFYLRIVEAEKRSLKKRFI